MLAAGLAVLAVGVAAGCGGGGRTASTGAVRASAEPGRPLVIGLRAAGYTVRHSVSVGAIRSGLPRPVAAFDVPDVDWTTAQSFSVAVYVLPSPAAAARFARTLLAGLPSYEQVGSEAFRRDHTLSVVGSDVFFAFTEMDPTLCASTGLCREYSVVGAARCPPGSSCVGGPGALPSSDVSALVAAAERGRRA